MNVLLGIIGILVAAVFGIVALDMADWKKYLACLIAGTYAYALVSVSSTRQRQALSRALSPRLSATTYRRLTRRAARWPRDWRLYDWALRLAVLYPITVAIAPWILFGLPVVLGGAPENGGVQIIVASPTVWLQIAVVAAMIIAASSAVVERTCFPNLDMAVRAIKGRMVLFHNCHAGTALRHPDSLHGGLPVEAGEKWACNLWFRERNCRGDRSQPKVSGFSRII